jgi:hypothetical protein
VEQILQKRRKWKASYHHQADDVERMKRSFTSASEQQHEKQYEFL